MCSGAYGWLRGAIMANPNTVMAGSTTHATVPEASASSSLSTSTDATGSAAVATARKIATARPPGVSPRYEENTTTIGTTNAYAAAQNDRSGADVLYSEFHHLQYAVNFPRSSVFSPYSFNRFPTLPLP